MNVLQCSWFKTCRNSVRCFCSRSTSALPAYSLRSKTYRWEFLCKLLLHVRDTSLLSSTLRIQFLDTLAKYRSIWRWGLWSRTSPVWIEVAVWNENGGSRCVCTWKSEFSTSQLNAVWSRISGCPRVRWRLGVWTVNESCSFTLFLFTPVCLSFVCHPLAGKKIGCIY